MKRTSLIILIGSAALTVLLIVLWIAGFVFAPSAVGGLIHILLLLSFVTGFGVVIGGVLFLVSVLQKK